MKKFLLSIFCMLSIMNYAYADEVKFDFTAPSGLTPSITDDMLSDAGNDAYAFNTDETTFTNNGVTLNTTKGSTDSRIWKSAKGVYDFRVYKTATMTIAAPEGGVITAIAFNGSTVNSFSANSGTVDGKNWTGAATSVVFTWAGDAGTQKINSITVTFSTDGSVTPDPEEPEGGEGEGSGETPEEPVVPEEPETPTTSAIVATYELTQNDMATAWENKVVSNTYAEYTLEYSYGSWTGKYNFTKNGTAYTLGLNPEKGAYLQSPVSYGVVESVSIVITNGSSSKNRTITLTGGTESKTISVPAGTTNKEFVFDTFSTEFDSFKLTTSETLQISSIKVVCPPSYTLSVSDAGWATMFLGFDAEIVDGAKAYIVKTEGVSADKVTLTEITGTIPANTGVIVKAEQGDYEFNYSTENVANVTGNLLNGSVEDTYVEGTAYVLANHAETGVGMYKAELNKDATGADGTTHFKNNANKAYLVLPAEQSTAAFYGFDWNGTTGVDEITENRVQSTVIYDLAGRRVENITAPGIYVVGGKKVLVK